MFGFIKNKLKKIYDSVTTKLHSLFSREKIDQDALAELERILIAADTGVHTTRGIMTELQKKFERGQITQGQDLKNALEELLLAILSSKKHEPSSELFLLVGINGSGKTTFAAKLANHFKQEGKKPLLVAADTFRDVGQYRHVVHTGSFSLPRTLATCWPVAAGKCQPSSPMSWVNG